MITERNNVHLLTELNGETVSQTTTEKWYPAYRHQRNESDESTPDWQPAKRKEGLAGCLDD